jgi:hypothetical protein
MGREAMSWMNEKLSDAERVARAVEIRPGVFAAPWERGCICKRCNSDD